MTSKSEDIKTSKSLSLVIQPTQLVFTENGEYSRPSLVIPRKAIVEPTLTKTTTLNGTVYEKLIYAILGVFPLLSGPYLILVTDCESVGTLDGHNILKIKDVEIFPIADQGAINRLPKHLQKEEQKYIHMLYDVLRTHPHFYFSYSFNLSKSYAHYLKRKSSGSDDEKKKKSAIPKPNEGIPNEPDLWSDIEDRFVWNSHLQGKFIDLAREFGNWFPPLIQGFALIKKDCNINNNKLGFLLISRRSKKHAGTRYHTRGVDEEGNVANYVETEQCVEFADGRITSFVQIRGSVPVVWKQEPNLDYEPPIVVYDETSTASFQKHFQDQLSLYDNIIAIDLLQGRGKELKIGSAYKKYSEKLAIPGLKYVDFDLHHICKHTKLDKLSILVDKIDKDLTNTVGYSIFFNGEEKKKTKWSF